MAELQDPHVLFWERLAHQLIRSGTSSATLHRLSPQLILADGMMPEHQPLPPNTLLHFVVL